MAGNGPQKTRVYDKHPIIDSERWSVYNHRPGDIVITTSYKAGTTWMQTIVANLLYQDGNFPAPVSVMAPWLDMALPPLDEVAAGLEAQEGRRFIKTHLPLDGIPFYDTMKYIYVGRDGRDVFMSMWNHHSNYNDDLNAMARATAAAHGREWPAEYADIHAMWRDWVGSSWFDWEESGFPYWSHLHHVQSWWDHRDLPNIHFVHFADLLADPEGAIRRLAAYLDIEIDEAMLPGILERISFGAMKKGFQNIMPEADDIWRGGGSTFMNKGTNGRWRGVLTDEELGQYDAVVAKALAPDCARWLEHGGPV
ncbi:MULTISPECIES: sulfotransferase domain-containing protein [Kordiimonas]|jgi:aryl sulfotransferase|uniref:sulfotransferase domain-containing protein n=1 Tax=Kordiimonas TaxID=288021 RepID=UPI00257FD065|nr:sulfotransferase domain-containing protein [Kordiimonas sp. UBA4487]